MSLERSEADLSPSGANRRSTSEMKGKSSVRLLIVLAGVLLSASLTAESLDVLTGSVPRSDLKWLLAVDEENNLPTWFSSFLLASAAALSFFSGLKALTRRTAVGWRVLAVLLVVMSADEVVGFHELVNRYLGESGALGIEMRSPWVVPGILVVAVIGVASRQFLPWLTIQVSGAIRRAALVYVSGALGFEIIWVLALRCGWSSPWVTLALVHIEEGLEMAGAILLIQAISVVLSERSRDP